MACALLAGLISLPRGPYLVMPAILMLVAFTYRDALRPLGSYKFWIPISLLIIVFPILPEIRIEPLLASATVVLC